MPHSAQAHGRKDQKLTAAAKAMGKGRSCHQAVAALVAVRSFPGARCRTTDNDHDDCDEDEDKNEVDNEDEDEDE